MHKVTEPQPGGPTAPAARRADDHIRGLQQVQAPVVGAARPPQLRSAGLPGLTVESRGAGDTEPDPATAENPPLLTGFIA